MMWLMVALQLTQQINALIRKEQKVLPAYQRVSFASVDSHCLDAGSW